MLLIVLAAVVTGGCAREEAVAPDTGLMLASSQAVPIGVFGGSAMTQNVASFGRRLGRPVDLVHEYLAKRTWTDIKDVYHRAETWRKAGFAGRTVFTVPMLPDSGGTLAGGAAGDYNAHFRILAEKLVAGGHDMAILRLGPEFNGTWFRWSINRPNGGRDYGAYWRQVVRTMRSVKGARFKFDWSPNAGSSYVSAKRQLSAESAYPGDRYVDYIGLDVFDQSWADDTDSPSKRWRQLVRQKDGLNWQSRFAAKHRKPMTFPEWGLVYRRDKRGGGDNPYFIRKMYEWMQTHPVAYHLYFESSDPTGDYRVFGGRFPQAAKTFVRLFGVPGARSVAQPPG